MFNLRFFTQDDWNTSAHESVRPAINKPTKDDGDHNLRLIGLYMYLLEKDENNDANKQSSNENLLIHMRIDIGA